MTPFISPDSTQYLRLLSTSDGSSKEDSAKSHAVFGSVDTLDAMVGSLSVIFTVAAVLLIEKFFEQLHHLTRDTAFQDMVTSIERELMVVGFLAFLFKIIMFNSTFIDGKWLMGVEYAGRVFRPRP